MKCHRFSLLSWTRLCEQQTGSRASYCPLPSVSLLEILESMPSQLGFPCDGQFLRMVGGGLFSLSCYASISLFFGLLTLGEVRCNSRSCGSPAEMSMCPGTEGRLKSTVSEGCRTCRDLLQFKSAQWTEPTWTSLEMDQTPEETTNL